jgi:hypothetical protein
VDLAKPSFMNFMDFMVEIYGGKTVGRNRTAKGRMSKQRSRGYVPGTPEERIAMVWPLTREACSLSKRHGPDRPMQRHVTRVSGRRNRCG